MKKIIPVILLLCICSISNANNRIIVKSYDDIKKALNIEGCKYVIFGTIDLEGSVLELPKDSKLVFKEGCFFNGTLIGNKTRVYETKDNVFRQCQIKGDWQLDCAYSSMFDNDLEAATLLNNLSCLSSKIKLFANRSYQIRDKGYVIKAESISAADKQKPLLEFHTTNPNKVGLIIIGDNISISNLIIVDDYSTDNDAIFGFNDITNGSTLGVQAYSNTTCNLHIECCDFKGGTSSSFIASSQVKNCIVKNCSFSGYISDHAVYCSSNLESFEILDCSVTNIEHSSGLFKIRSSNNLKLYSLKNIKAHNINGYLAIVSLLETSSARLLFENIELTKDKNCPYIFCGFCVTDDSQLLEDTNRFNANQLTIKRCRFDYGYRGESLIYHGSGKRAKIKNVKFLRTNTNESNFGGVFSDELIVKNSCFENCCSEQGVFIASRFVLISNTKISRRNITGGCMFLVNYAHSIVKRFKMKGVVINASLADLYRINEGKDLTFSMNKCSIPQITRSIFYSHHRSQFDYKINRCKFYSETIPTTEIFY